MKPQFDAIPPVPADRRRRVAVIGAGVVGLSAAVWLQRAGHSVILIDRSPPGSGTYQQAASFGNACTMAYGACIPVASPGVLMQVPRMLADRRGPLSLFWRDFPSLVPWLLAFIRSSAPAEVSRIVTVLGILLRAAEGGHASLIEESGASGLIRRQGCLYLYKSAEKFASAAKDIAYREREGVRMSILDAQAIREAEPGLAPVYHKAVRFEDTYFLDDPAAYARALLDLVVQRGGQIVQEDVQSMQSTSMGMSLNLTGHTLTADRVVVAAGAWSKRLARTLGDRVLLDSERGYHVLFPEDGARLNAPCCYPEHGFYMTPLREGLRAAGTVELGGLDAPARAVRTQTIAKIARELVPGLSGVGREWLGFRPSMPDSLPVISFAPTDDRVVYAFGHGHIGLTLAGITGRLVAEMIGGQEPSLDIRPMRSDRF